MDEKVKRVEKNVQRVNTIKGVASGEKDCTMPCRLQVCF